jgi:hypothetical protein
MALFSATAGLSLTAASAAAGSKRKGGEGTGRRYRCLSLTENLFRAKRGTPKSPTDSAEDPKFETYDELHPCLIPGVSRSFLESMGITEQLITSLVEKIPPYPPDGRRLLFSAIPVYTAIQKLIASQSVPIVGIVERGASSAVIYALLQRMVDDNIIRDSARRAVLADVKRYKIGDELLFGCMLEQGEYLRPLTINKNIERRAHDRWESTIKQMPSIRTTMLKTSDHAFPFRVEFGSAISEASCDRTMKLIYHTALLLPNYAFPVGIDIADKFAKIPDWLSKGVSAQLAATIYKRCVQSGNIRLLEQMRNMLGRSPRDFFYRPGA